MSRILVRDILDTDTRAAGWWTSADGQGQIDMTGATLAEARAELLDQEHNTDRHEDILNGSIEIMD